MTLDFGFSISFLDALPVVFCIEYVSNAYSLTYLALHQPTSLNAICQSFIWLHHFLMYLVNDNYICTLFPPRVVT